MRGSNLPESVRDGQRLTGMTSGQDKFPLVGSNYNFKQYGESRAWVSELMPYVGKIADELCFVKSMHTEAINHDPAITFFKLITTTWKTKHGFMDELWTWKLK